jgi:hypothetical protein
VGAQLDSANPKITYDVRFCLTGDEVTDPLAYENLNFRLALILSGNARFIEPEEGETLPNPEIEAAIWRLNDLICKT